MCTKWVNSYTCMPTKNIPHKIVAASHPRSIFRLPFCAPYRASTTKSELKSSSAVPTVTSGISMIGSNTFPVAGSFQTSWANGPTRLLPLCTR